MARAYLAEYFDTNCDKLPNPSGCTQIWHLPSCLTRLAVYNGYREWVACCPELGPRVSHNTLLKIWREEFNHVRIPAWSRFKQCTTYVIGKIIMSMFSA